jgi:hypothetical protein
MERYILYKKAGLGEDPVKVEYRLTREGDDLLLSSTLGISGLVAQICQGKFPAPLPEHELTTLSAPRTFFSSGTIDLPASPEELAEFRRIYSKSQRSINL